MAWPKRLRLNFDGEFARLLGVDDVEIIDSRTGRNIEPDILDVHDRILSWPCELGPCSTIFHTSGFAPPFIGQMSVSSSARPSNLPFGLLCSQRLLQFWSVFPPQESKRRRSRPSLALSPFLSATALSLIGPPTIQAAANWTLSPSVTCLA